ncbi:hypothetical protein SISNIDRAFT_351267 [Sistotremastrum niveocremeum HHB9708]|uniref:Nudix hydrolase domain-containing protein n=1 Tax=Sistotremastrum niveocremeum HHB9708 TaxID=1314777 RepID=A0A164X0H5_9AGAM|nr:hypothetical protein SISNIDRAFT_351267 [Sistotremastrum niveocremeum HHB9708]
MIQPSTGKVAIVWDTKHPEGYAFLPKGRKDVGESLEQAALREATEESGYECQFLPLDIPHHCPKGSAPSRNPSHEPIYVSVIHNGPHRRRHYIDPGTEYFTFWYIAQIAADAIPRDDTRMPDEQSYRTELLSYEQASAALFQFGTLEQLQVLNVAYDLWTQSLKDAESANRGGQSTGGQTTMMN